MFKILGDNSERKLKKVVQIKHRQVEQYRIWSPGDAFVAKNYSLEIVRVAFFDLDGTIQRAIKGDFINIPSDVEIIPDVIESFSTSEIYNKWLIVGVTNQGGIGAGFKTEANFKAQVLRLFELFEEKLGHNPFYAVYYSPFWKGVAKDNSEDREFFQRDSCLRKPNTGMIAVCEMELLQKNIVINWEKSFMVGDKDCDKRCATRAGLKYFDREDFFKNGSGKQ